MDEFFMMVLNTHNCTCVKSPNIRPQQRKVDSYTSEFYIKAQRHIRHTYQIYTIITMQKMIGLGFF